MPISPYVKKRQAPLKIAVTLGDPAGIGPEVALKAIASLGQKKFPAQILLLGQARFYEKLSKRLKLSLKFQEVNSIEENVGTKVACYYPARFPEDVERGQSQTSLTQAAIFSIRTAATLALKAKVQAIVTPPINKAALKKAGFTMLGHTEYLAELSKAKKYEMMLVGGNLRVVLVTRHMAIGQVPKHIRTKRVLETLALTDYELQRSFGIAKPRIVVCGLNPHAGEEGSFGMEEIKAIAPAVKAYRKKTKSKIFGPLSPDALFHDAYLGRYDAEICMYHDQGLIPLKMISRGFGVNITLGLPFVRTSPDHGTAYDIAQRFIADAGSMKEALSTAVALCQNQRRYERTRKTR